MRPIGIRFSASASASFSVEPEAFDVYYAGALTGRLTASQTPLAKLVPAPPPPPKAAAPAAKPAVAQVAPVPQ